MEIRMNRKPLISVLVPYRDKPEMDFMTQTWIPLYEKRNILDFATISINRWLMNDTPHISTSRNGLVDMASDRNSDYVYFLDSDMVLKKPHDSAEALRLLYEEICRVDVDIIGGIYLDKRNMRICARKWNKDTERYVSVLRKEVEGAVTEVDMMGMGCCLIDTRIFNAIDRPWFKCDEFPQEPGEDIYFCNKARSQGFKLWLHGDVIFDHWGKKKFTLDDEEAFEIKL